MNKFGLIGLMSLLLVSMVSATGSWGFQNGNVVWLNYSNSNGCAPSLAVLYQGYGPAVNASTVTNCQVGIGIQPSIGAFPTYQLVPAFAGLSTFGYTSWNATANGYATFNGVTIATHCGAAGTTTSCGQGVANAITNYYSYGTTIFEWALGITNGKNGLPEGVLPNSAHDLLIPTVSSGPTYLVRVSVYDPNIFPNATTGKCTQWVASNLTNPTANCLNNVAALANAINTKDSAVSLANKNNVLFTSRGMAPVQAAIHVTTVVNTTLAGNVDRKIEQPLRAYVINVTSGTALNVTASNLNAQRMLVSVSAAAPSTSNTTANSTTPVTVQPPATAAPQATNTTTTSSGGSSTTTIVIVIAVIIVIAAAAWMMMKKK